MPSLFAETGAGVNYPTTVTFAYSIKRYLASPGTAVTARFIKMTVTGTCWLFEDNFEVLGTTPASILSGSFLQPSSTNLVWGRTDFNYVFGYLRDLKMDHLIWQNTASTELDANPSVSTISILVRVEIFFNMSSSKFVVG